MRILRSVTAVILVVHLLVTSSPCLAAEQEAGRAARLAAVYQAGFLDVTGTACFQLYSSMGIIATDLSNGYITGSTALEALEQNGLLLSVCQSSLAEVQELTDASDTQGTELLSRLAGMLKALGGLHEALVDAASAPRSDEAAIRSAEAAVLSAGEQVEAAFAAYALPL